MPTDNLWNFSHLFTTMSFFIVRAGPNRLLASFGGSLLPVALRALRALPAWFLEKIWSKPYNVRQWVEMLRCHEAMASAENLVCLGVITDCSCFNWLNIHDTSNQHFPCDSANVNHYSWITLHAPTRVGYTPMKTKNWNEHGDLKKEFPALEISLFRFHTGGGVWAVCPPRDSQSSPNLAGTPSALRGTSLPHRGSGNRSYRFTRKQNQLKHIR